MPERARAQERSEQVGLLLWVPSPLGTASAVSITALRGRQMRALG